MSMFPWLCVLRVPVIVWQLMLLVGLVLMVVSLSRVKNAVRWIVCFGGGMVIVAAFFLSWYAYARQCCWVRVCEPVCLRAGPGQRYHAIGEAGTQELGCVEQVCGDWKCIRTRTCKGWAYLP